MRVEGGALSRRCARPYPPSPAARAHHTPGLRIHPRAAPPVAARFARAPWHTAQRMRAVIAGGRWFLLAPASRSSSTWSWVVILGSLNPFSASCARWASPRCRPTSRSKTGGVGRVGVGGRDVEGVAHACGTRQRAVRTFPATAGGEWRCYPRGGLMLRMLGP